MDTLTSSPALASGVCPVPAEITLGCLFMEIVLLRPDLEAAVVPDVGFGALYLVLPPTPRAKQPGKPQAPSNSSEAP